MSDALLIAILGVQLTMIAGLAKLWWNHIVECRARIAEMASMKTEIQHIKHEVGDHSTGIRGSIHELRNFVTPMVLWAQGERDHRK